MRAEERQQEVEEEEEAGGIDGGIPERGKDGEIALGSAQKTCGIRMDPAAEDGQSSGQVAGAATASAWQEMGGRTVTMLGRTVLMATRATSCRHKTHKQGQPTGTAAYHVTRAPPSDVSAR